MTNARASLRNVVPRLCFLRDVKNLIMIVHCQINFLPPSVPVAWLL